MLFIEDWRMRSVVPVSGVTSNWSFAFLEMVEPSMYRFFLLTGRPTKYSDAVGICFCKMTGFGYLTVRTVITGLTTVIGSSCRTITRCWVLTCWRIGVLLTCCVGVLSSFLLTSFFFSGFELFFYSWMFLRLDDAANTFFTDFFSCESFLLDLSECIEFWCCEVLASRVGNTVFVLKKSQLQSADLIGSLHIR